MNLIKPKKLQSGSTIGLLSVSGCIKEVERMERAKKYFENKGFKVVVSDTTYKKYRYMAGSDEERLEALHGFFADDKIDAIVCTRGGFGAIRLLKNIDFNLIKNNPKIFVGYSDITALLAMIYKKTRLVTFHGPMANGDFGEEMINNLTEEFFYSILEDSSIMPIFNANEGFKTYYSGIGEGILWGGNLSTLVSLAGLDFIPDEKFVLFLEDLNEPVYKLDKMISQLLNIDKFKENLSGIALGQFTGIDDGECLTALFEELALKLKIPIADGFLISHDKEKFTLPIGIKCFFDADKGSIELKESCLTE